MRKIIKQEDMFITTRGKVSFLTSLVAIFLLIAGNVQATGIQPAASMFSSTTANTQLVRATAGTDLTVSGNLRVEGSISRSGGAVKINDGLLQLGSGQVTFNGNIDAYRGLDVRDGMLRVKDQFTVEENGDTTINGDLDVTSDIRMNGDQFHVESNGDTTIKGDLVVTSDISGADSITVEDVVVTGDATVGTSTSDTLTVASTATFSGPVSVADLTVSGTTTMSDLSAGLLHADSTGVLTSSAIVNADLDDAAAIALSKLASGTSGQVIVANADGVPTYVALSGDATIAAGGALTIGSSAVALSELANSGTLTATTVDINGGAIDATTIGATSASTGAFTTLGATGTSTLATVDINAGAIDATTIGATSASTGAFTTLTSTGVSTIGNNSATVAINSSDWDIDATGVVTGVAIDANGTGNAITNIETGDVAADTLTAADLAATLTFADADLVDLSAIVHNDAVAQGLRLPNSAGAPTAITSNPEGYIAWDASNDVLYVTTGSGWTAVSNSIGANNTWTGENTYSDDVTFTLAGTEDFDITTDLAGTVDALAIVATPSSTSGTTNGIFVQQADGPASNGLDVGIQVENADTDLAIADGILVESAAAGGITNAIRVLGTAGTIVDAIDASSSGITNALNAGTANIVGTTGAITYTGATSHTTTGGNLTIQSNFETGILTLGGGDTLPTAVAGGNDVEIRAEDDAFVTTTDDVLVDATGGIVTIDGGEAVDAAITLQGTADGSGVHITAGDGEVAAIGTNESIELRATADTIVGLAAAGSLVVDADTTNSTNADGALDINLGTTTDGVEAIDIAVTQDDGTTAAADAIGQTITLTANDANGDMFGLVINGASTVNAAAGSYEAGVKIDNADNVGSSMTDGVIVTSSGADGGVVDAFDASDSNIDNALNIGANAIQGTTGSISLTDFQVTSDGVMTLSPDADTTALTVSPSVAMTTAIDVTDTDITNGISVGTNNIAITTGTIGSNDATVLDFEDFDVTADGLMTFASDSVSADDQISITLSAGDHQALVVNASSATNSSTDGIIDLNIGAGLAAVDGINVGLTMNDGASTGVDYEGVVIGLTADDADGDMFGLKISGAASTNAAAGSYEAGLWIDNAEETAGSMTDGIRILSSGANTGITDAIDVSASNLDNAINVGANDIEGTTATMTFTDFGLGADGNMTFTSDAGGDQISITAPAAEFQALVVNATTNDSTQTAGMIDLNVDSTTANAILGVSLAGTAVADGETDAIYGNWTNIIVENDTLLGTDQVYGQFVSITQNDTDGTGFGYAFVAEDSGTSAISTGLLIDNQQSTDIDLTDGIRIIATTDGSLPDAIDVSDAEITNAINVGANVITGTTGAITYTGATSWTSTGGNVTLQSNFDTGILTLAGGDTLPAAVANGNDVEIRAEDDAILTTTDDVLVDATAGIVTIDGGEAVDAAITLQGTADGSGVHITAGDGEVAAIGTNESIELRASGNVIVGLPATGQMVIDGDTTDLTHANGALAVNLGTTSTAVGIGLSVVNGDDIGADTAIGQGINLDNNATAVDDVVYGMYIDSLDNGTTDTDMVADAFIVMDNSDTTAADLVADGILFSSAGGAITDAIDASTAAITNALSVGANTIVGTTGAITYTGATSWTSTGGNVTLQSNFDTGNLTLAGGDTLPAAVANGNDVEIRAEDDAILTTTDDVLVDATAGIVTIDGGESVDAAITLQATGDNGGILLTAGDGETAAVGTNESIEFHATADVIVGLAAAGSLVVEADATNTTDTSGVLDINVGTQTTGASGINLTFVDDNGDLGADTLYGQIITVDDNATDTDDTVYGLYVDSADNGATDTDQVASALVVLDQSDTDDAMADGLLFVSAGGAITDAIDASTSAITNALNVGANSIVGTTGAITYTGATSWTSTGGSVTLQSNFDTSNLTLAGGDTLPGAVANGNDVEIRAEDDAIVTTTDDVLVDATAGIVTIDGGESVDAAITLQATGDNGGILLTAGDGETAAVGTNESIELHATADVIVGLAAAGSLVVEADATNTTDTSGVLDINVGTQTNTASGINLTVVDDDGDAGADTIYGMLLNVDDNATDSNDTVYGLYIDSLSNGITDTDQVAAAGVAIDNSDADDAMADGIIFVSAGGAITDAIDASAAEITNAINVAANTITGTTGAITYSGSTTWSSTGGNVTIQSNFETGNLMLLGGDNAPGTTADGNDVQINAEDDVLMLTSDDVLIDATGGIVTIDGGEAVDAAITLQGTGDNSGVHITAGDGEVVAVGTNESIELRASADTIAALTAGGSLVVDGDTTNTTNTDGALDINVGTTTTGAMGMNLTFTNDNGDAGADTTYAAVINVDDNATDANDTVYGLYLDAPDNAVTDTDLLASALAVLDNSDTDDAMTDGMLFVSAGGAITDAIDASAAEIDNALNIGANDIEGTTATITFTDLGVGADGNLTFASDLAGDEITIVTPAADFQAMVVDGTTADSTQTAGMIDLNVDSSTTTAVLGVSLTATSIDDDATDTLYGNKTDVTIQDDTTGTDVVYGEYIGLTQNDTSGTGIGLAVTAEDAGTSVVSTGILVQNLQATDIDMTDAIKVQATTDASIVDGVDVSDAELTNAVNAGANPILMDAMQMTGTAGGTITFEDSSGNDMMTIVDDGTDGTVTVSSTLQGDAAGSNALGGTSKEWGTVYIGDDNGIEFGLDQDVKITYDETTDDRLEVANGAGGGSTADFWIEDKLGLGRQTLTMATGGAAAENLTVASSYVEVTGQDNAADTVTILTTNAKEGDLLIITNLDSTAIAIDTAATVKLSGGADVALTQYDVMMLIFDGTNWLQVAGVTANS